MAELLAPAGSYDSLRAAVNAGADAVYIGGSMFGARAYADNPDQEGLLSGIDYCHIHGRQIYLTVNTLLKDRELEEQLYGYLLPFYREGLDGVIVQDLGVMELIHSQFPGLPVHASTQMTVTGPDSARLLKEQGVTRVVTARELSLEEVRAIIKETGLEVETFIHGAMCYSYSGQCLLSSLLGGRSGNRGRCAQPCRLPYETAAGDRGYLLSMKDMCTLDLLPDLVDAGIASLKIEGRMKRPEYTAGVVSIYRKYLDQYEKSGRKGYHILEEDRRILMDLYNRGGFSGGYYRMHNGPEMMAMTRPNHQGTLAARITAGKNGKTKAEALEPLHKRDVLESPDGRWKLTLSSDVAAGAPLPLPAKGPALKKNTVLYRTKSEELLAQLSGAYLGQECKEKIKGHLSLLKGRPAILELSCGDVTTTVSSEQEISPAQSSPATEKAVRAQMEKTGNTPFSFEEMTISMEENLFLPVRELKELRRCGLTALSQALLDRRRRREPRDFKEPPSSQTKRPLSGEGKSTPNSNEAIISAQTETNDLKPRQLPAADGDRKLRQTDGDGQKPGQDAPALTVLVTFPEQLQAVMEFCDSGIRTVYLDLLAAHQNGKLDFSRLESAMSQVRQRGYQCFLNLPPVFRKRDRELFQSDQMKRLMGKADGCLVHTLDELAYLRDRWPRLPIAGDDTLYAYNRRAASFLREQGLERRTLPAELNFRELLALSESGGFHAAPEPPYAFPEAAACETELTVYGRQPLMHSAQCVVKNTRGCTARPETTWIRDRKQARFPVVNRCMSCCNTIYNSVPLELGGCEKEIRALAPDYLRLSFTVETAGETKEVLARYSGRLYSGEAFTGGTRGHFRRGVE